MLAMPGLVHDGVSLASSSFIHPCSHGILQDQGSRGRIQSGIKVVTLTFEAPFEHCHFH